jgi:hypothetical protein
VNKSADIDIAHSNVDTTATANKKPGKFKDTLSLASTALPIAGAVGTVGVWLAATFYVGEIQVTPDRPYNTLEVRVSDKKGQESVFHTPHFQLMPGRYHLEVTVDSQFKHHEDITAAFHKNTNIAMHVPTSAGSAGAAGSAATVTSSTTATPGSGDSSATRPSSQAGIAAAQPIDEDWGTEPGDTGKKRWWQFWKKSTPDK